MYQAGPPTRSRAPLVGKRLANLVGGFLAAFDGVDGAERGDATSRAAIPGIKATLICQLSGGANIGSSAWPIMAASCS